MGDVTDSSAKIWNPQTWLDSETLGLVPPDIPPAEPAPIPDDKARKREKERAVQRRYAKAGRAGTVLSSDTDKLG